MVASCAGRTNECAAPHNDGGSIWTVSDSDTLRAQLYHSIAIAYDTLSPTMSACPPYAPFFGFAGVASSVSIPPILLDVLAHVRDVFQMIFSSAWGNLGRATVPY